MDALPPDPYAALGVAKDATSAAIKQQYRKLVLKFHPDKVQDDALKQAAADDFHKVQTAYEIVGDDDRRQRYDAQCKLAELRKVAMERGGGGSRGGPDVRTAGFKVPTDSGDFYARGPERSGRMSPRYEERRPHYADDYFSSPRPMSRKDSDFDRASKRGSPRDDSKKSKTSAKKSKENERSSRDERARRSEQERGKDRDRKEDRKYAFVSEHSPTSDSDDYERARRQRREDEDRRKVQAWEEERRREEEATANFFGTERTQKMFNQDYVAREYMSKGVVPPLERSSSDRRPSPVRKSSSREKVEYIKRNDGKPPVMIRRGSGRPEMTRDSRKSSSREKDIEIVDEPQEMPRQEMPRRPPPLTKMQSSPTDIRSPYDRQRASSLQFDPRDPPIPGMKRAETMPYPATSGAAGESRRKDPSKLRTEVPHGLPTPEPSPEPPATRKHSYGQIYADDNEFPTPDGYRTEFREPAAKPRFERSPSPIREPRERQRGTSVKYPQPPTPKRTTSTTYSYPMAPESSDPNGRRPSLQREGSSRLFGEVPTSRPSPRPQTQAKYSPPAEDISYSKSIRPEDAKYRRPYEEIAPKMSTGRDRTRDRVRTSRQGTPVPAR